MYALIPHIQVILDGPHAHQSEADTAHLRAPVKCKMKRYTLGSHVPQRAWTCKPTISSKMRAFRCLTSVLTHARLTAERAGALGWEFTTRMDS